MARWIVDSLVYVFREGLRGPTPYRLLLAGLAVMAAYGLYLWLFVQHAPVTLGSREGGLILTGVNEDVPWGLYISFFTFWVGVAASAVIFSFAAYVYNDKAFKGVVAIAEAQAVVALVITVLGITANLGRPDRAIILMPQLPNLRSMLNWDFIVIFTYMALNAVAFLYTVHLLRSGAGGPGRRFIIPFMIVSTPFAIGIHTVTAWIFHALTARPALNTALLAPRFIATAFASGPALLLLILYIAERATGWFRVDERVYRRTLDVIAASLATGLFFTLAEVHEVFWYTSEPSKQAQLYAAIVGGVIPLVSTLFWLWVALGIAAFVLAVTPRVRASRGGAALVALVTFAAVFSEKTLATILPGFVVNPLNLPAEYEIAPIEVFVSIGIHALALILLSIMVRSYLVAYRSSGGGPE